MSEARLATSHDPTSTPAEPSARTAVDHALSLVSAEMRRVQEALAERMQSPIGAIPEIGAHLLDAGGKRLRPLLAVLAARATEAPPTLGVAVGVAAELIHTATLYHDDVVDDGRVRRGRPAARLVYGNGLVVLVGDFCLARALETVAATGVLPTVRSLASTVTEMAEGEVAQLQHAGNPDATAASYFEVIDRKTASLIAWCARVGDAVPDRAWLPALDAYGRALGRAFQVTDDVLDCAAPEEVAGKSVGHDIREGKLTLPVLLACDLDGGLRDLVRRELGERGVSEAAAQDILTRTRQVGGVEAARRRAVALAAEAAAALDKLPPSAYRDALRDLALFSADRVS